MNHVYIKYCLGQFKQNIENDHNTNCMCEQIKSSYESLGCKCTIIKYPEKGLIEVTVEK